VTQRLLADLTGEGAPDTLHVSSPCTPEELATLGRVAAAFGLGLRSVVLARAFGQLPGAVPGSLGEASESGQALTVSLVEAVVGASPGLECLK
jgi:hypothetical protein